MEQETKNLIVGINPSDIIIVGDTGVVSSDVENFAKSISKSVTRLGGLDRYETSLKIFNHFGSTSNSAVVATGLGFADALSGSYLGAKVGSPILLVSPNSLEKQRDLIKQLKLNKLYLLGGEVVISNSMVNTLTK